MCLTNGNGNKWWQTPVGAIVTAVILSVTGSTGIQMTGVARHDPATGAELGAVESRLRHMETVQTHQTDLITKFIISGPEKVTASQKELLQGQKEMLRIIEDIYYTMKKYNE